VFLGASHASVPRGRSSSVPQNVVTSYIRADSMRNGNQILHGDQSGFPEGIRKKGKEGK